MKKTPLLITTALIGAITLSTTPNIARSEVSTKVGGAIGMGSVAPEQAKSNSFWWPERLDISALRDHDARSNPLGDDFDYAKAFNALDLESVKKDIDTLLTTSQDWWPADYGNYGPFFIRMTWHSAGTYRTLDGRGGGGGGQQRFEPLNSWPDNGNLDKARRLLWPVKKKYGAALSWSDLMILAGTVAMDNMGFKTYGFAGGRTDDWEPDMVYWGPEVEMLASDRKNKQGELKRPLGATHMGLIYVNPEGPMGKPDPLGSAKNIRTAFDRMAMNDEETVALIAGGHTFGKMHGAHKPKDCVGVEPAAAPIEDQGIGWKNKCGKGHSEDTTTSGLEGAWTQAPTQWTTMYLENLLNNEWEQTTSPAGAIQWIPKDKDTHETVPNAHIEGKFHAPVMTTADLALKYDSEYRKIVERFLANPDQYQQAFAKAWYKLTHRDMGPKTRYLGDDVAKGDLMWQDPIPDPGYDTISAANIAVLKQHIIESDITVSEWVRLAWASASTFRASDMRGGANGARIALEPQISWAVNQPKEIVKAIDTLKTIKEDSGINISLADLIVLAGAAAIETAAAAAGVDDITVPFVAGRGDALQEQTDRASFAILEPKADAFRNYIDEEASYRSPTEMLIDKADQLNLTVPEMTVLIGGMRALNANVNGNKHGVFTDKPGTLSNDFFVHLLDNDMVWKKSAIDGIYEGSKRGAEGVTYTATPVDLIFGAHSELRAVAETYAFDDSHKRFVTDFVRAWTKVMQADRFDLASQ